MIIFDAALWFLTLQALSFAAFPIAFRAFSRMPDRGYAFAKPLGLLITGFTAGLIGMNGIVPVSNLTVLGAGVVLVGISALAARNRWIEIGRFLRRHVPLILTVEALFVLVFVIVAMLRATVPDIATTEQPMDLMFLSSTAASPNYPPTDAWFAGEPVSYYYLGYLLIGSIALLTNTITPIAYGLGLATYGALAAVTAFGLVFNLVRLSRGSFLAGALAGMASVFLVLGASNALGILELAWLSEAGSASFWAWVTPHPDWYNDPQAATSWRPTDGWWWWRASRAAPNTITEFPAFSFLLGDMHPHVMSIPYVILAMGIAVQIYLRPGIMQGDLFRRHFPLIFVTALGIGGLGAINLWDLPLGLTLIGGATFLNAARNERRIQFGRSLAFTERFLIVGAAAGPRAEDDLSTALLYEKREGRWSLAHRIEARGLGADSDFGASVAAQGDTVAVSAPKANITGLVELYTLEEDRWLHAAALMPDDEEGVVNFGQSIAIDGDTVAVASLEAVYVYSRDEAGEWTLAARLAPSTPHGLMTQVALEDDILAAGVRSAEGWVVDVYKRSGNEWAHSSTINPFFTDASLFGRSLSLDAGRLAIGGDALVSIYSEAARGWVPTARIGCPVPSARRTFGSSVALQGYYLVVGAPGGKGPAPNAGCAFVIEETSRGWYPQATLQVEDASIDTALGSAVAIRNDTVVLGAPGGGQGGVYSFQRALETWTHDGEITGRKRFGRAVATAGLLITGALLAALPYLFTFEGSAEGILPLEGEMTRPAHLMLVWGGFALLSIPLFLVAMRHVLRQGNWSLLRFSICILAAFIPVLLWMQPIFGLPVIAVAMVLFAFHQMGWKQPHADEALFAFNPRVTLIGGSIAIIAGILWYSIIISGERGIGGELLAIDRLVTVVPLALIAGLAFYGAWTLAHRDSEAMRVAVERERASQWNAIAPLLGLLGTAAVLVMGAELFHVVDVFGGGALRRMNTIFKLYYQAWLLLAIVSGFSVWFVTTRWNMTATVGRVGGYAWRVSVALLFIALAYYPAAAAVTRIEEHDRFTLDGLSYLTVPAPAGYETIRSPADYETIEWITENTPRGAVVLEGSLVPCAENPVGCNDWKPELARIASATGRPTILGWEGHEQQWRSSANFAERQRDVRRIYATDDPAEAARLLDKYEVEYVVVSPRERAVYGEAGIPKFSIIGRAVFDASPITVYRIETQGAG